MNLGDLAIKKMVSIPTDYSIFDAVTVMAEKNIGAILVHKNKDIIGIFTERDLLKKVVPQKMNIMTKTIEEVMTGNLISLPEDATPHQAMQLMVKKNIRHLTVANKTGKVVGVTGIRDVMRHIVKSLIDVNKSLSKELESFRYSIFLEE